MAKITETLDKNYIKFGRNKINIIIDVFNNVWFCARDLIDALEYSEQTKPVKSIVSKENKLKLKQINISVTINKHPNTVYVSESGMYELLLSSRMEKAEKFKKWITRDILPSIRKYGYYKLKEKYDSTMEEIKNKISYLEKENEILKKDLTKDKYPNGGMVYVIDFSDEKNNIYRIGMTDNMDKRKKIYDTHSFHRKQVVYFVETDCPRKLETCIRSMLYDYRYKNNKDFYVCELKTIKKLFTLCQKSLKCMNQKGGNFIEKKVNTLKKKLEILKKKMENIRK
jgi:prophage antirepressor-like protein